MAMATQDQYVSACFSLERNLGCGSFGCVGLYRPPKNTSYFRPKLPNQSIQGGRVVSENSTHNNFDDNNHQFLVIKEIQDANDEEAKNEVDMLQRVNHEYIVGYLGYFFNRARHLCIVMEFCECGTLTEYVGRLPKQEYNVWRFLSHMASALDYLHHQRPPILHRDIKPDNILGCRAPGPAQGQGVPQAGAAAVTTTPDSPNPDPMISVTVWKLADFGIAKVLKRKAQGEYYASSCAGTLNYMAPEVIKTAAATFDPEEFAADGAGGLAGRGGGIPVGADSGGGDAADRAYGTPADIWSLGCVVSFYTNERQLFRSPVAPLLWTGESSGLSRDRYGPELRGLIRRTLSPDPAGRPNAADVLIDCYLDRRTDTPKKKEKKKKKGAVSKADGTDTGGAGAQKDSNDEPSGRGSDLPRRSSSTPSVPSCVTPDDDPSFFPDHSPGLSPVGDGARPDDPRKDGQAQVGETTEKEKCPTPAAAAVAFDQKHFSEEEEGVGGRSSPTNFWPPPPPRIPIPPPGLGRARPGEREKAAVSPRPRGGRPEGQEGNEPPRPAAQFFQGDPVPGGDPAAGADEELAKVLAKVRGWSAEESEQEETIKKGQRF